jgi:hypothetical protein
LFYFHMWMQNPATTFTLSHPLLLPTPPHWYLLPEKTRFTLLFVFKVHFNSPRGFSLVFHTCIYHAFIKLIPLLLALSLSPCYPNIQWLMVQYVMFICRWIVSIFSIV